MLVKPRLMMASGPRVIVGWAFGDRGDLNAATLPSSFPWPGSDNGPRVLMTRWFVTGE